MRIYNQLDKIGFLRKSYTLKFLFVAFIGTHIPLIGIIIWVQFISTNYLTNYHLIFLVLIFTLIAAIATLYVLNKLLNPLHLSNKALRNFISKNELPNLKEHYTDEAGELMSLIQKSLVSLDMMIKEKQQITALLSHNLRTPINQIKGLCEILKTEKEDSLLYIENISKLADTQQHVLRDLLNQLMYNYIPIDFVKEKFDIIELVNQEIEAVDIDVKFKNLSISIYHKLNNKIVENDKSKIALILHNLLSNAIKFSFEGQEIKINIFNSDNKIYLQVIDNGIGFNNDLKEYLFKDARNLGRAGTNNEPSVGLGLYLCKRTIHQLDGDLQAESLGQNKGATFTLIL